MAVGCKIIRDFPRPARELVERFRGVATSNLVDVMGSCAAIDGGACAHRAWEAAGHGVSGTSAAGRQSDASRGNRSGAAGRCACD